MNTRITAAAVATALLACAGAAQADVSVLTTITADNHYALYTTTNTGVSYVDRNELGAGGAPGSYNWSQAESATFTALDYVYIAAWSDDATAQGLLAKVTIGGNSFNSGHPAWQVYATGQNLGDGSPAPAASEIASYVNLATTNNLWTTPYVGGANGISPWGTVAGIDSSAKWMWYSPNGQNTLTPGGNYSEYLIFRIPTTNVPTPGAAALLGLGGLCMARRRRA